LPDASGNVIPTFIDGKAAEKTCAETRYGQKWSPLFLWDKSKSFPQRSLILGVSL
jgi:hypothetical protein